MVWSSSTMSLHSDSYFQCSLLTRIHRCTRMDGVRTVEGG